MFEVFIYNNQVIISQIFWLTLPITALSLFFFVMFYISMDASWGYLGDEELASLRVFLFLFVLQVLLIPDILLNEAKILFFYLFLLVLGLVIYLLSKVEFLNDSYIILNLFGFRSIRELVWDIKYERGIRKSRRRNNRANRKHYRKFERPLHREQKKTKRRERSANRFIFFFKIFSKDFRKEVGKKLSEE